MRMANVCSQLRGWKETVCKYHLKESLLTLHCSLESQELFYWNLQLLNRTCAQRGISKWAGETGEEVWLRGAEEKEAEVVTSAGIRWARQDGFQIDSICCPK